MTFNKMIPELLVSNITESLHFYIDILNFKIEYSREKNNFYFLSKGKCQIMICLDPIIGIKENKEEWITGQLDYPRGRGINFQIEIKNIKKLIKNINDNNINLYSELSEKWRKVNKKEYGEIEFLIQDPDGYLLRFSETIGVRKCKIH